MANNIDIKDASGTTKTIRTVDDGSGRQYNQSIPTDSQGNIASVVSNGQAARSSDGGLVVAIHPTSPLPAGTNLLGKVSLAGLINGAVSVAGNLPGIDTMPKLVANTDKVVIGAVSIADGSITVGTHAVTQSGTWSINAALTSTNNNVAITSVGTSPVAVGHGVAATALRVELPTDGTGVVGLNAGTNLIGGVSVRGIVSVVFDGANANIPVSIANSLTLSLGTNNNNMALVSVGTDPVQQGTGTTAKTLRVTLAGNNTDKLVIGAVSIADSTLGVSFPSSMNVALTSTNNNVAITSIGTNPVAVGTGAAATALRVAVAPNTDKTVIGAVSIADSTLGVSFPSSMNVALTSTNNNVALTSIGTNPVPIGAGTVTQALRTVLAGNNTDKVVVGAVSVADSTLAATQSGTWSVGINAGTNLIGAVSVRGNLIGSVSISNIADVSVQDNAPVSVRGGLIGLNAGTNAIGKLAVNTDKVVIGAVSLADGTLPTGPVTQSGTWTVQPGNTPNTAPWLVTPVPSSVGGPLTYHKIVSATDTSGSLIKGAAGQVYGIACFNNGAGALYFRLFNKATAPAASDTPFASFIVPGNTAGAGYILPIGAYGIPLGTGIGWRISGGLVPADATAPADNQGYVNVWYS